MAELGLLAHNVLDNINKTADLYYQSKEVEGNKAMQEVIVNLTGFVDSVNDERVINDILDKLKEALQAMEDKDYVYLADLLKYEIGEVINEYV